LIAALAGLAATGPSTARAQQARPLPRIGRLSIGNSSIDEAFRQGLRDFGYAEGKNLLVEFRSASEAQGQLDRFVAELIALKVDAIVAASSQTTRAAFNQTRTIPIVTPSTNPVGLGFVASLAKPGGNVTGVSLLGPEVSRKRLQLLKQALPGISRVAVIWIRMIPPRTSRSKKRKPPPRRWALIFKFLKRAVPMRSIALWRLRRIPARMPLSCCRRHSLTGLRGRLRV
jgi:hypothetical protein